MSRPQVLLVALAVLAVLATLPLRKGSEEEEGGAAFAMDTNARAWPCCDKCGLCLLMYPPQCNCMDFSERGCHPACRKCVRYTADGSSISQEPPVYRYADLLTNFCQRRCTPATVVA
ncbi:hypothetical protein SEVIR_9G201800v4 [Setaria viridis]|uniref:Bowman-Birk serine protease inhibitors family domain-containing protein n=2 Tax=Setaria TaxID=4554 RepID=K4ALJ3_SETIT|nr:Bowman-Birk type trypsin inhibitor [Setaria italica]XP_034570285.1 Bowman-Birk type trypsin inhibitor-like [Setaria viridis]RCV42270.1 hypothetical protein SETIT_9G203300v2 [Setaria italica]TKV93064.1 hypothetical protein SEVIR_9G201800v2 [Setaria viridis]